MSGKAAHNITYTATFSSIDQIPAHRVCFLAILEGAGDPGMLRPSSI